MVIYVTYVYYLESFNPKYMYVCVCMRVWYLHHLENNIYINGFLHKELKHDTVIVTLLSLI